MLQANTVSQPTYKQQHLLLQLPSAFNITGDVGVIGRICSDAMGQPSVDLKGIFHLLKPFALPGTAFLVKMTGEGRPASASGFIS